MNNLPLYRHSNTTEKIIEAFYQVYNTLGHGFLEKVYQNALYVELQTSGITVVSHPPIQVRYRGVEVGEYIPDMIVEQCVVVEIKALKSLTSEHEAQLLNYLKATDIEVGLLLNFGPKAEIKRKVFSRDYIPNK